MPVEIKSCLSIESENESEQQKQQIGRILGVPKVGPILSVFKRTKFSFNLGCLLNLYLSSVFIGLLKHGRI